MAYNSQAEFGKIRLGSLAAVATGDEIIAASQCRTSADFDAVIARINHRIAGF